MMLSLETLRFCREFVARDLDKARNWAKTCSREGIAEAQEIVAKDIARLAELDAEIAAKEVHDA